MKKGMRISVLVLLIAMVIGAIIWQYRRAGQEALPLETIAGNGVIEATEVDISAEIAGRVRDILPREGDDITAGQLLAVLDDSPLAGQRRTSEGNLQASEAAYAELRAGTRSEEIQRAQALYDAALNAVQQAKSVQALLKAGARDELLAQLRARQSQLAAQLALLQAGARPEELSALEATYKQFAAQAELVEAGPREEVVQQIQAALAQAQVNQADAENELKRATRLYERGAIPLRTVESAQARFDAAVAGVQSVQARLQEARTGARPQEIRASEQAAQAAYERWQSAKSGARPQEIQAAEAALEVARQQVREAEAGARPEELHQADAQVASAEAQARAARAALVLAKKGPRAQTLTAANSRIQQAQGQLETVRSREAQTKIYAPSAGRVTMRAVEPGETVTPGLPLLRITRLNTVWIRVYVPATAIGQIKIGQSAEVRTDAYTRKQYHGRVVEIAQQAEFTPKNVQTRQERVKLVFAVKIEVENPDGELKPGMPGDAIIDLRS